MVQAPKALSRVPTEPRTQPESLTVSELRSEICGFVLMGKKNSSEMPVPCLLTRSDVANRLQTCNHTIQRYTKRGLLPAIVINCRVIRYRPEDVEKLIQSGMVGNGGPR